MTVPIARTASVIFFLSLFLFGCGRAHECGDEVEELAEFLQEVEGINDYRPDGANEACNFEMPRSSSDALDLSSSIFVHCVDLCPDQMVRFFSYYNGTLRVQRHLCSTIDEPGIDLVHSQFNQRLNTLVDLASELNSCIEVKENRRTASAPAKAGGRSSGESPLSAANLGQALNEGSQEVFCNLIAL